MIDEFDDPKDSLGNNDENNNNNSDNGDEARHIAGVNPPEQKSKAELMAEFKQLLAKAWQEVSDNIKKMGVSEQQAKGDFMAALVTELAQSHIEQIKTALTRNSKYKNIIGKKPGSRGSKKSRDDDSKGR